MVAALLALAVSVSSAVVIAPIEALGVDEADVGKVAAAVDVAVRAARHDPLAGLAVDDTCAQDAACVSAKAAGRPLLRLTVLRVGSDVDVKEALFGPDGVVLAEAARQVTMEAFLAAPLGPEVSAALIALAPSPAALEQTPAASGPPSIHPGLFVAGGAAVVGVASAIGFAVEAATLEDPGSPGGAKERARVTGWVFLGTLAASVVGVGAGAAWALTTEAAAPHDAATTQLSPDVKG